MARKEDPAFDITFYESVLRREPAYTDVIELLGGLYTKTGRIADGLKMDRKLVKLQPDNSTAHYNLACSLALSKRKTDALCALQEAINRGYTDYDWMSQDSDLQSLQTSAGFKAILAKLKSQN
jgi:tetratricopeptide (TPR) repeat protein